MYVTGQGITIHVKGDSTISAPANSWRVSDIYIEAYNQTEDEYYDAEIKLDANLIMSTPTQQGYALRFDGEELKLSGSGILDISAMGTGESLGTCGINSTGYWETNALTFTDTVKVQVKSSMNGIDGNSCLGMSVGEGVTLTVKFKKAGLGSVVFQLALNEDALIMERIENTGSMEFVLEKTAE